MAYRRGGNCSGRTRKQHGGGVGSTYTFAPGNVLTNNDRALTTSPGCMAASRPGMIGGYSAHGLPGMQSGGRRKHKTRKQNGGSYTFGGATVLPNGLSYANHQAAGCTAPSLVPFPQTGGTLNERGGYLWDGPTQTTQTTSTHTQRGGGRELGEVVPTASYSSLKPGGYFQTGSGTLVNAITRQSGGGGGEGEEEGEGAAGVEEAGAEEAEEEEAEGEEGSSAPPASKLSSAGLRSYVCEICGYTTNRKSDLMIHMNLRHSDEEAKQARESMKRFRGYHGSQQGYGTPLGNSKRKQHKNRKTRRN
jgi:hypothetical protein